MTSGGAGRLPGTPRRCWRPSRWRRDTTGNVLGESLELEHIGVRQSPFATFIDYHVKK
jgi:hypothetical protein